jgi:hypothetical protein
MPKSQGGCYKGCGFVFPVRMEGLRLNGIADRGCLVSGLRSNEGRIGS